MSFKIIKELSLKIKKAVPILLLLITTSCSNGKVGYWEFKIIEKSINTIENIIKIPRKKSSQRIEIPKAPEPPKELKNIAVIDLLGNNISDGETKALSDKLRAELFNTRHFKILECVVKIGQLLGVEKIVGGTINKVGETFSTSARIINTSTGTIEKIVSFDYSGPIDELLKKGMRKIAIELIIN